jgi:hypothetical protein
MKPKGLYLGLCIVGTVLPYSQFLPFLREHGLDLRLFAEQLFSNRVGGFFGMDVIVSSVVLWVLVLFEGRRGGSEASLGPHCGQPGRRRVVGSAAVPLHAREAARGVSLNAGLRRTGSLGAARLQAGAGVKGLAQRRPPNSTPREGTTWPA